MRRSSLTEGVTVPRRLYSALHLILPIPPCGRVAALLTSCATAGLMLSSPTSLGARASGAPSPVPTTPWGSSDRQTRPPRH